MADRQSDDYEYRSLAEVIDDMFPGAAERLAEPSLWGVPMEDRPSLYEDVRRG